MDCRPPQVEPCAPSPPSARRRTSGFTLLELLTTIVIVAILSVGLVYYIVNYSQFTQQTADSHSLQTLNTSLEMYKLYGGMVVSHSLVGPNNEAKIQAVVGAMKNGYTVQGSLVHFLNPSYTPQVAGLTISGQGANFLFGAYNSQQTVPSPEYPGISVSGNMNFGGVLVGSTATATLNIYNPGATALNVSSITLPGGFSITAPNNWNSGSINPLASQNVSVTFSPAAMTGYGGNLTIASNAPGGQSSLNVPLSGQGLMKEISLSGNMAFGTVLINTPTASILTISNPGNATLTVSSINLPTGYTITAPYNWTSGTIAGGGYQYATVTFDPTQVQDYSGGGTDVITVNSDSMSGTNTMAISGAGGEPVISMPASLAFGTVLINTTSTQTLTIQNTGGTPLHVSHITPPAGFTITAPYNWNSGTIGANSSQQVSITFSPTAIQSYSGNNLTVASDALSGSGSVALTGAGGEPVISVTGSLAFGNVTVNTASTPQTMTIQNTGGTPLHVSNIAISAPYAITAPYNWTSGTIAANSSQQVSITFSPTAVQSYPSSVNVTSDSVGGSGSCTLGGAGVSGSNPSPANFVAITTGGSTASAYSYDGISWTGGSLPWSATAPSSGINTNVAYGKGKYVAVGYDTTSAAYSVDGINWTISNLPVADIWWDITYGGGTFVAIGATYAVYSTDGINWTASTLPTNAAWEAIGYGDGKFVVVSWHDNGAAYSANGGSSWSSASLPVGSSQWEAVSYGNGRFVAANYASGVDAYSYDGVNWTAASTTSSNQEALAYGDSMFAAIPWGGGSGTGSADGMTWSPFTIPSGDWCWLAFSNGTFATAAYGGSAAACSTNGTTWTTTSMPSTQNWGGIAGSDQGYEIDVTGNMAFGNVAHNTTAQALMTIANTGSQPITVGSISYPAGYSGDWSGGSIPAGNTQSVHVTFSPTAVQNYNGIITVNCNARNFTTTLYATGAGT
jgi:prepilin-type N-terminal cleavage/methylation domain-containing protein